MNRSSSVVACVAACAVLLSGCGTETTGPIDAEFEVIEKTTFAPALGIDLSKMTRLTTGVYIQDLTVGTGPELHLGRSGTFRYTGWLRTGTRFTQGETRFLMGNSEVILGFEQGVVGMQVGGIRRIIIPPVLAFGANGSATVPPGAIVIYEAELLSIS